jgi:two-component system CheB/CheR fusion protein
LDSQREADRLAVNKYAPPGVVLDAQLEVQQFRGDTSPYLAQASGKPTTNILKMAREGLLVALRSALDKVRTEGTSVRWEAVHIRFDTSVRIVNLEVMPLGRPGPERGYLVFFEENDRQYLPPNVDGVHSPVVNNDDEVARVTQELAATREYMQSLIDQHEASNEELQSANEEIQSSNEELQSINEELQTSKEEIQSANEELATVNDELRNRNEQLDRTHNDLNNFIASGKLPMVMVGRDLRIRHFSPSTEKVLNLIRADIGRLISELRFPLDLPDLDELLMRAIHEGESSEREVQDRQNCWYLLRIHPYLTTSKVVDGAVIVLVDIDAQRRAKETIRRAEEKYHLLIEGAAGVAIMLLDRESKVEGWNVGAERIFGYPAAEIMGQHFSRFYTPEDLSNEKPARELEQARSGMTANDETWLVRKDGSRFWAAGVTDLLRDGTGSERGFSKVVRDITDKKQAEELQRKSDRRKDEFLATLAHELRNPLAPLSNTLETLRRSDRNSATVDRGLGMMERQVEQLKHLVADILEVARINAGHIELRRETIDLRSVIAHVIEMEEPRIIAAKLDLSTNLQLEPVWVEGDSLRLEQIFANLVDNSLKYSDPGGRIELAVEVNHPPSDQARGEVTVQVKDTGIGIPRERLSDIFEYFVRGEDSLARRTGGLGVGLSLVKSLVELHSGTIEVSSEGPGKGSTFTVRLPLVSEPEASESMMADQSNTSGDGVQSTPRRILLIDDNQDAAQALAGLLRVFGHEVTIALNGPDGLETASTFSPEVVFVDIAMPEMDGYEVARRLRRRAGPRIKLLALSGYGRDEDRARSLDAGFDMHLIKPIDANRLTALLDQD